MGRKHTKEKGKRDKKENGTEGKQKPLQRKKQKGNNGKESN